MNAEGKKAAAAKAALDFVEEGATIGVGTGSTANHFIDLLAVGPRRPGAAVASSVATERRLRERGIPVVPLPEVERLSVYVDGADEATLTGQLIKGGGGALTREKIVASASDLFVCILDDSKMVAKLGAFPLPVEVIPLAVRVVAAALVRLGGRPALRQGFSTDNGNLILDVAGLAIENPRALEQTINDLPGVVTCGLFCLRGADVLIVAGDAGTEVHQVDRR